MIDDIVEQIYLTVKFVCHIDCFCDIAGANICKRCTHFFNAIMCAYAAKWAELGLNCWINGPFTQMAEILKKAR